MEKVTSFQRDLLYVISGLEEATPESISAELSDYYNGSIPQGRFDPNVEAIVELGLVNREYKDDESRTEPVFELSENGKEELKERKIWEDKHIGDLL